MAKQIYKWSSVRPGDIISFRYKGNKPTATLTTLLVLNPKIPFEGKTGKRYLKDMKDGKSYKIGKSKWKSKNRDKIFKP